MPTTPARLRFTIALGLAGLAAGSLFAAPPPAGPAAPLAVHVMSFNIRFGDENDGVNHWDRRKIMVFDVIRNEAPDAVGLQESLPFQVDQILANVPGYAALDWTPGKGGLGFSTVLYRTDRFSVGESGTFWLAGNPDAPPRHWARQHRTCQWARLVENGTGRAFYFYNTHLRHGPVGPRTTGAKLIVRRIDARAHPDPYVLVGDMNDTFGSEPIAFLRSRLLETYRAVHAGSRTEGTGHGFTGETTHGKIDYIFAVNGTQVTSSDIIHYGVNGRYPSDHFPLTARLELPSGPPAGGAVPAAAGAHRVTFRARAGLARGAGPSNGVVFSLMSWDGRRWAVLAQRLVRPDDGTVAIVQDISALYGADRALILGADANGNTGWDWAHWVEAVVEVDGAPAIDLIEQAPRARWHSRRGDIAWGSGGPDGTAFYGANVTMMDGRTFPRTLYVHPDFRDALNGFSHGAYAGVNLVSARP